MAKFRSPLLCTWKGPEIFLLLLTPIHVWIQLFCKCWTHMNLFNPPNNPGGKDHSLVCGRDRQGCAHACWEAGAGRSLAVLPGPHGMSESHLGWEVFTVAAITGQSILFREQSARSIKADWVQAGTQLRTIKQSEWQLTKAWYSKWREKKRDLSKTVFKAEVTEVSYWFKNINITPQCQVHKLSFKQISEWGGSHGWLALEPSDESYVPSR